MIKFDYMHTNATLQVMGRLVCDTQPYYPAVLTSVDDHTMGESIWWAYSGFPQPATNGAVYLDLSAAENASLKNLRVFYADRGVTTPAATRRLDIWNSQFIDCQTAIEDQIDGGEDGLHNVLIAGCTTALRASDNHCSFAAEHLTADVIHFWSAAIPPDRVGLTNSIVKGALAGGSFLVNQNSSLNPTGAVFQTVNVGN